MKKKDAKKNLPQKKLDLKQMESVKKCLDGSCEVFNKDIRKEKAKDRKNIEDIFDKKISNNKYNGAKRSKTK